MKLKPLKQSLNNKGQSLVVFVALLPVLILIIAFIFELGNASSIKNKYENIITNAVSYGLNHQEDENLENKLKRLLDANLDGDKEVTINENNITIHVKYTPQGIYSKLFKQNFEIDLTYQGQFASKKITKE